MSALRSVFMYTAIMVLYAWSMIASPYLMAAEPRRVVEVEGITEYQLENGLKVLFFPDGSRPTVTVNMTVLVGSRHEGYGEGGMAHLLEHMVFKGTPTHPNVPKALRDRGAAFNGTTNADRTNYFETLPATDDNLEFAIRFEADRLVNSLIRREDLLSEMTVVRNEFERSENSPQSLLGKRMMAAAFDWHNYGKTTIGNRSDIERVPIDNLQDFYRRYYQPDNAVLIVAGKFDEARSLKLIQQYFGAIPRPQRKLNTTYTEEPPQDGERVVELRRVGDVGIVAASWHIPAASHEDHAPLEMLGSILSTAPSGRLYKSLVETRLAASAFAGADARHDPGVFDIQADVRRDSSLEAARHALLKAVEELIASGVTDEEVERAKRSFLNARRQASLNTSSLAVGLSTWVAYGDWRLYFLHRDRVEKVTPADVQRVAAKYLVTSNRTVGYFIPASAPDLVAVPSTPDVPALVAEYHGRPPVASVEAFDFSYAHVDSRTTRSRLPNGIKVALLPKPTRDQEVNVRLTLRYGNADSLKDLREACAFLPALMNRGTKRLSYQQLRDEMSRLDVQVGAGSGGGGGRGGRGRGGGASGTPGSISFSVRAKRSSLLAALDLLQQIMREPALDEKELDMLKPSRIAAREESRADPSVRASDLLARTLSPYPPDDVRAILTADEEIARIQAVTIDQVRRVHREFLGAEHGELVVIGDFDPAPTLERISGILADWKPAQQDYARIEQQAFVQIPGSKHSISTPDKANASYVAGLTIAMNDQDPEYAALVIGNFIFGGGSLSSRLGDRIRQKEGLSYGVGSSFTAGTEDQLARWSINAICNPANIGKVQRAVEEELALLLKDGVTAEELDKAKRAWLQSRELARSSDFFIADRLERGLRLDQTLAYEAALEAKVASLTPDDVHAALRKHMDPRRLVVVIAGDFAQGGGN